MALTLNGSNNTIAGVAVGGLPDGIVDTDMIAANAVTGAKTANEMTTGSKSLNIGGMRVVMGTFTTSSSASSTDDQYGISNRKYIGHVASNVYSGFAAAPMVTCEIDTDYHEAKINGIEDVSTTGFKVWCAASRVQGVQSRVISWIAIGVAS